MCFSKPNVPNTADELRATEDARAARVKETSNEVNKIFDEGYGPSYYSGMGDAFRKYYQPQVGQQFQDARRATTLRTADNANSSAANRQSANLARDNLKAMQDVESGALDAQTHAKQDVENKRGQLLSLAEAGSSLENTAAMARAATTSGIGKPTYSPLGDIFGKYTSTLGSAVNAGNNGNPVNPVYQKQIDFLRGGGSGSSKVIGG